MVTQNYFPGDAYDTPAETPRLAIDRLFGHSRWYFYWRFLKVVLRASSLAKRGLYDDEHWHASSFSVFCDIERCGGRFHISGLDHIRSAPRPLVFISNHMSTLETIIFPVVINPICPVTFVIKKNLASMPIFGPIMRSRRPVLVGRENPREDLQTVLSEGSRLLASGKSIVIFPQSTRQDVFDPDRFNSLGVKLARRARVTVIPVAVKTDFWGNGKRLKEFGPIRRQNPIHMAFGAPMPVTGSGKFEHEQIVAFITGHLRQWSKTQKV